MENSFMKKSQIEEVKYIRCILPVRYEDEDMPYDFPFRNGKIWDVIIEAESGRILGFPTDYPFNLEMKVVDEGIYSLLDENKEVIAYLHEEYVPDSYTIPGEYGDYIHFRIEEGYIKNWYSSKERKYKEFIDVDEEQD